MRLMHPHMEAKQIHPPLQTLQVRQEVPGSAQLSDIYFLFAVLQAIWGFLSADAGDL